MTNLKERLVGEARLAIRSSLHLQRMVLLLKPKGTNHFCKSSSSNMDVCVCVCVCGMIVCASKLQSHPAMLDTTTRLPSVPAQPDVCEYDSTCSQPHCKAAHIHRSMFAGLLHSR